VPDQAKGPGAGGEKRAWDGGKEAAEKTLSRGGGICDEKKEHSCPEHPKCWEKAGEKRSSGDSRRGESQVREGRQTKGVKAPTNEQGVSGDVPITS